MKRRSAMSDAFFDSWKQSDCDWISWCGGWMPFDGELFVKRGG